MMKRTSQGLLSIFLSLGLAANAAAYTIDDSYWGADHHGYGDVIGSSHFQIKGIDVAFSGGFMDVRVHTNYKDGVGAAFQTTYGDLFISTDGWSPHTVASPTSCNGAPYACDDASNGESWEYVFDTDAGALYGGNFTVENSFILINGTFRNGQEVRRANGGISYIGDESSVNLDNVGGVNGFIDYHINMASLGSYGDELGLHWAMTCANDVIEGSVSVDEPPPVALMGLGLAGLAWMRRRKKKKNTT